MSSAGRVAILHESNASISTEMWLIVSLGSIPQLRYLFVIGLEKARRLVGEDNTRDGWCRAPWHTTEILSTTIPEVAYGSNHSRYSYSREVRKDMTVQKIEKEAKILPLGGFITATKDVRVSYDDQAQHV